MAKKTNQNPTGVIARSLNHTHSLLKMKAPSRSSALTLRLGLKKHILPMDVRMITAEGVVFLHIPSQVAIMQMVDGQLCPITDPRAAEEASKKLRIGRPSKAVRQRTAVEIPAEVAAALNKLPKGYKLGYNDKGQVKLVKQRKKRS